MIDITSTPVKWAIRVTYILILLLVFFVGILLSFLGSYDLNNWNAGKSVLLYVNNADVGPTALYYTNMSVSGVIGFNCSANGNKAFPGLLDQNGNQVGAQYLSGGNDITWYDMSMSSGQFLVIGLVITNLNTPQPYTIYLYQTKDLRALPRAIGPIVWFILFGLVVVFEWRLWVYEKKYGDGSDNANKENRRKTRFFSKH